MPKQQDKQFAVVQHFFQCLGAAIFRAVENRDFFLGFQNYFDRQSAIDREDFVTAHQAICATEVHV